MRRSIVFIVLIVALGLLTSGLALADPGPTPPSSTADVSGGIFKEANDKFLSTTEFGDLESKVLFLQFDMPSAALAGQGFEIGGTTTLAGMYVGAYLNSIIQGINGQLGGGDSQTTTIDKAFLVDGGGVITGTTEARSVSVDYDIDSMNDVRALVGLGPMGIGLRVLQNASNGRGSYVPTGTFPGGLTWNAIGVSTVAATANSLTTRDAAGALVSVSSDAYGLGKDNNRTLDFTASFGMPLAISDAMDLAVGGDLLFGLRNNDESAAREQYSRVVGSGTAISYTPAQALDGATPAAIDDLTSYTYSDAMQADSHMMIAPSAFAKVEMPLGENTTAMGGLTLGASLPIYSAKYNDNAGAQQKVAGLADSYYTIDVLPALNPADPALIQTTTTTARGWQTQEMSSMTVDVDLSGGVEVAPNDRFRFGVQMMPMVSYSSTKSTYSGEAVQTTVVDNGDGADGIDDSVTRATISRSGYTETTKQITVTNQVNTAAQFFLMPERLRVNLGAQVDTTLLDKTLAETVTNGILERTDELAADTTDTAATTFVNTSYQFNPDVRAATDDSQTVSDAGSSSIVYDAGLTFFFDESMFLDLRMDASGGDIWSTNEWSLEMTILY